MVAQAVDGGCDGGTSECADGGTSECATMSDGLIALHALYMYS